MADSVKTTNRLERENYFGEYFRSLRTRRRRQEFNIKKYLPTWFGSHYWQRFKDFRQGESQDIADIAGFFAGGEVNFKPGYNIGRAVSVLEMEHDGGKRSRGLKKAHMRRLRRLVKLNNKNDLMSRPLSRTAGGSDSTETGEDGFDEEQQGLTNELLSRPDMFGGRMIRDNNPELDSFDGAEDEEEDEDEEEEDEDEEDEDEDEEEGKNEDEDGEEEGEGNKEGDEQEQKGEGESDKPTNEGGEGGQEGASQKAADRVKAAAKAAKEAAKAAKAAARIMARAAWWLIINIIWPLAVKFGGWIALAIFVIWIVVIIYNSIF
ncbi:hypothetical protein KJ903_04960 [Patescibacteria group bacterium]|nr:hypothetical protein [Patescibacteria group bacterium]